LASGNAPTTCVRLSISRFNLSPSQRRRQLQ
jgi:hypothetical protein